MNGKITRPVLRYHGGKFRLAKWIISHFAAHRVYTEVYGGAASVLLQKPRTYSEVYNDKNDEVVNLFRVLRDPAQAKDLLNQLALTPFARPEFQLSYEPCADPIESARRLVVRSFMGFGSGAGSNQKYQTGFRCNSNRSGTTPAHDWQNFPAALPVIIERLRGVVIENRAANEVLLQHDQKDALHYVDPPYPHDTRSYVTAATDQPYAHEMSDADHHEMLCTLLGLQGMVALSSYPCEMYESLLIPAGWMQCLRAAHADGARDRVEVLWLNPALAKARQSTLFDTEH